MGRGILFRQLRLTKGVVFCRRQALKQLIVRVSANQKTRFAKWVFFCVKKSELLAVYSGGTVQRQSKGDDGKQKHIEM